MMTKENLNPPRPIFVLDHAFRSIFALAVGIGIILRPINPFPLVANFRWFWVGGSLLSIR